MSKKILISFIIIIGIVLLTACSRTDLVDQEENNAPNISADRVEVVYFYATQRCFACITIGNFTKEVIYEFFQAELRDGKIEFKEINIDLNENRDLVKKFQARGSGLYINTIYSDDQKIEEDIQVWRLLNNENQFKNYLKNKLNNLLGK